MVICNKNSKILLFSICTSAFCSLVLFLCISTIVLKFFFSFTFFFITFFLQLIFLKYDLKINFNSFFHNHFLREKNFIFLLALIGTLVVLFSSFNVTLDSSSIWGTFSSLSLSGWLRVIFGYYLSSFFIGYVLMSSLLDSSKFNFFERIGISLTLNFILITVTGLFILKFGLSLNVYSLLLFVWMLTLTIKLIGSKINTNKPTNGVPFFSPSNSFLHYVLVFFVAISLLFSFYFAAMNSTPFAGVLCSDIPEYISTSNQFLISDLGQRSAYPSWVGFNCWITSCFVNLPNLQTYAGMQFYILVILFSIYFFCKTLFRSENSAAISATLISTTAGFTSLGLLFSNEADYFTAPALVLNGLEKTMGLKLLSTMHLNGYAILHAITLAGASSVFGLSFFYLFYKSNKLEHLFFCSIFLSASMFFNNLVLFFCSFLAINLFCVIKQQYKKLVKFLLATIFMCIFFDFLSNNFFINYLTNLYITNLSGPYAIYTFSHVIIVLVLFTIISVISILVFGKKYNFSFSTLFKKFIFSRLKIHPKLTNNSPFILCLISVLLFVLSLTISGLNYGEFVFTSTSSPYPWYYQIIYYGAVLLFALGFVSLVIKKFSKSLTFMWCWIFCILVNIAFSFLSPGFFPSEIWALRLTFFLVYPLASLAAIGMCELFSIHRFRKSSYFISIILLLILLPSFLSYIYTTEFWFYSGLSEPVTCDAAEWMYNTLPDNALVLTLTENSYKTVTNLASKTAIPVESLPSWPMLLLSTSESPEDVLSLLINLGATHVYLSSDDNCVSGFTTLFSILNCFDVVFESENEMVYTVPKNVFFSDSSYKLISGISDSYDSNYFNLFSLLVSNNQPFTVTKDITTDYSDENNVYFFSSNEKISHESFHQLLTSVSSGSNIIFTNSDFASCDNINSDLFFNEIFNVTYTNYCSSVLSISSDDGSNLTLDDEYSVRRLNIGLDVNVISVYKTTDGSNIPFICQKFYENGSIIFINFPEDVVIQQPYFNYVFSLLENNLHAPNMPNNPLSFYPADFYDFSTSWEFNLYQLTELHGLFLSNSSDFFSGYQTLTSLYSRLESKQLDVESLHIECEDFSENFSNITLLNLTIVGNGTIYARESVLNLLNPPELFSFFVAGGFGSSAKFTNAVVNAYVLLDNQTKKMSYYNVSVNLTTLSHYVAQVYRPVIHVNGDLWCSVQGGLMDDGDFFYTLPNSQNEYSSFNPIKISGDFSVEAQYSSGLLIQRITNIAFMKPSLTTDVPDFWWDLRWGHRLELTLDNNILNESLVTFPVSVYLSNNNFDFSQANSEGDDVRFTTNSGVLLDYELISWNSTSRIAELWVILPVINSEESFTRFYMYYGNENASKWITSTSIWDDQFILVNHFTTYDNQNFVDSTSNQNDILLIPQNDSIIVDGKVGSGWNLNGTSYGVVNSSSLLELNEFTCEVWLNCSSIPPYSARVIEKDSPWDAGWRIEVYSGKPLSAAVALVDSIYGKQYVGFGSFELNEWNYLVMTFKNGSLITYLNGVVIGVNNNVTAINFDGSYLTIGASHSFYALFDGCIDELRLSSIAFSESWVNAQYIYLTSSSITYEITSHG